MKLKIKWKEISILDLVFVVILFTLFALFSYINLFRYKEGLNSDIASEALLAREIWNTKQWIPDTWYSSTETRIVSTATWSALFYGISGKLSSAMGWGCILGMFFLLFCAKYLVKELQLEKTQGLLFLVLCLLLPNNIAEFQMLYIYAGYYVFHLGLFLWTMARYVRLLKDEKKSFGLGIVVYLLHFLLGGQGVRAILMISGPLLVIEIFRRIYMLYKEKSLDKKDNIITLSVLGSIIAGYLGNKLPFSVGQSLSRNIRNAPLKFIQQIIPHFLDTIWWNYLSVIEKIIMLIAFITIIYLISIIAIRVIKKGKVENVEWVFLTSVLSLFLTVMALTFTTIESANRYYIFIFFSIAFALVIIWNKNVFCKWIVMIIVMVSFVGNGVRFYIPLLTNEIGQKNTTLQVAEYLEEQGYEYGYTTFEHANYITVAVDGNVQVAAVNSMENLEICKWLTSEKWYVPNVPYVSKTAYIVTEGSLDDFQRVLEKYEEKIFFDKKIGMYHIYGSNYNYSKLTN